MGFERLRDHATESERADLTFVGVERLDEQTTLNSDADARGQTLFQRRLDRQQRERRGQQRDPQQRQAQVVADAAEHARRAPTSLQSRGRTEAGASASSGTHCQTEKSARQRPSRSSVRRSIRETVAARTRAVVAARRRRASTCVLAAPSAPSTASSAGSADVVTRRRARSAIAIRSTTSARRQSHSAAPRRRYDEQSACCVGQRHDDRREAVSAIGDALERGR